MAAETMARIRTKLRSLASRFSFSRACACGVSAIIAWNYTAGWCPGMTFTLEKRKAPLLLRNRPSHLLIDAFDKLFVIQGFLVRWIDLQGFAIKLERAAI